MKRFVRIYVRFVQRILITVLLTLLYFLGFGLTYVFALVCRRGLLFDRKGRDSYWEPAVDYDIDLETGSQQS